jgi:hypothetical protein
VDLRDAGRRREGEPPPRPEPGEVQDPAVMKKGGERRMLLGFRAKATLLVPFRVTVRRSNSKRQLILYCL